MIYDFETITNRRQTDSIKWAVAESELPMWIADMDFKTAPEITAALQEKLALGIYGYEEPREDYFAAVAHWYQKVHHARVNTDWLLFATGVIPALSSIVRRVSHVGDNVVVQTPVYNIFYNSIVNNGRHVLANELVYNEKNATYEIDFADLEAKLADSLTTMMILCNPHNPIGKVWSQTDLINIATLCQKYQVILVSDEIHGDLVLSGSDYTPLFSLATDFPKTITLVSPSKPFNVAALHAATVIVPEQNLHQQVNRGLNTDEVAEPNLLAIPSTIAAYTQGHDWLVALKEQLRQNQTTVAQFLQKKLPELRLVPQSATYLLWINCRDVCENAEQLATFLRQDTGLYLNAGNIYRGNGHHFLRMNIACPPATLQDGLERLEKGIRNFEKEYDLSN